MYRFSRFISSAAVTATLALIGATAAQAANVEGQLDPHFGNGGRIYHVFIDHSGTTPSVLSSVARAVGLQSDGKIIVAGDVNLGNGGIALARFNVDGSLDTSFGTQGERLLSFSNAVIHAKAMLVQPDDKIVIAGSYEASGTGNNQFLAIRFNADGVNVDSGFNLFGFQLIDFGSGSDVANSVALASDGSVYLAGYMTSNLGDLDFGLAKLKPNGLPDTTFGNYGQGRQQIFFDQGGDNDDAANAMAVQSDGMVVVAGGVRWADGRNEFGLARIDGSTGLLDTSFGNLSGYGGRSAVKFQLSGHFCYDDATALRITNVPYQGRHIYAAGTNCSNDPIARGAVAALKDDGTLDTSFGTGGKYFANLGLDYHNQQLTSLIVQPPLTRSFSLAIPPKLILVGSGQSSTFNDNADMLLTRISSDGIHDSTFGTNGRQVVYFNYAGGQGDDYSYASAMVGNGYVLIAGSRERSAAGGYDFAVARLLVGDGIFFDGFDPAGF